jgi:hypothetical protein
MLIDPEESLIDDSQLNNDNESETEQGSLIDDSPLNNEKEDQNEDATIILPPPD